MNQIPIENCSFNGNTICFYRAKMSLKLQFFPFPILMAKLWNGFEKRLTASDIYFCSSDIYPAKCDFFFVQSDMISFRCLHRHTQLSASAHAYISEGKLT